MNRFAGFCLLILAAGAVSAADIDPFTANQGPIVVGPGEEPPLDQAILVTDTVLGGFRILVPAVDEEAPPGTTARAEVAGGEFRCDAGPLGSCGTAYDRDLGPLFDFSQSSAFEIEVNAVSSNTVIGVVLFDFDGGLGFLIDENPAPGLLRLPFDEMIPTFLFPPPDLSRIEAVILVVLFDDEDVGISARIARFGTDGPILSGDTPAPEPNDELFAQLIQGNYRELGRSGEGCQLTRETDGETYILTCYVYLDGEQVWMIGSGALDNLFGSITFDDMVITEGADFGSAFDPADVVRTTFGTVEMVFLDCNDAMIFFEPVMPEFESVVLFTTKIVQGDCGMAPEEFSFDRRSGNLRALNRSGEGFQLAAEADGQTSILTWYTYLDGRQVWLIGSGAFEGDRIVFGDMVITSGADFGSAFDPDDVVRTPWGSITLEFSDCNNARVETRSVLPEFEDMEFEVTKIVQGPCD